MTIYVPIPEPPEQIVWKALCPACGVDSVWTQRPPGYTSQSHVPTVACDCIDDQPTIDYIPLPAPNARLSHRVANGAA